MRLRLVPVATLALAAALASVGCSNSGHPVGPSPSPFGPLPNVPVADSRPGVPAAAVKGFADALQLKRRKVHMIAGLTNGEHAVALLRFPDEGKETRRLVSFEYRARKKRWAVEAASSDLWDHPPAAGSRSYPVTSVPAGSWIGVGGFVDPKVRRLEAAGPTGSLVDQQPVKDGAALVFASPGSTLAGYDENGLVFATPVLAGLPQAVGGGDAAVGLGSTFAAEVISPRWAGRTDW